MDGGKGKKGSSGISLQQFITTTMPLIDMEKEAEIAASLDSGSLVPAATAKKRNSMLFNLKCTDVQTGLMGKALLVFEPNKGDVLPAHKFGPHDVVILRQNKAEAGSPSLGQGVVYRLKDSSITVAFDDIPEDGLNVPLRLEKVANEVEKTVAEFYAALKSKGEELRSTAETPAPLQVLPQLPHTLLV